MVGEDTNHGDGGEMQDNQLCIRIISDDTQVSTLVISTIGETLKRFIMRIA